MAKIACLRISQEAGLTFEQKKDSVPVRLLTGRPDVRLAGFFLPAKLRIVLGEFFQKLASVRRVEIFSPKPWRQLRIRRFGERL